MTASSDAPRPPIVERLNATDLDGCLTLSAAAGWNQVAADWRVFLRHGTVFGRREGGRLVATAAVLPFEAKIAWISMVLTLPGARGRGHATALLRAAIDHVAALGRTAFLDATPAGEPLYRRLGFTAGMAITRWRAEAPSAALARAWDDGASPAAFDIQTAATLDRQALGAARRFVLEDVLHRGSDTAVALPAPAQGFALARRGRAARQVGPAIAPDAHHAWELIRALLQPNSPHIVDIVEGHATLEAHLSAAGFARVRPFRRMYSGKPAAGRAEPLFAIAGPEFG